MGDRPRKHPKNTFPLLSIAKAKFSCIWDYLPRQACYNKPKQAKLILNGIFDDLMDYYWLLLIWSKIQAKCHLIGFSEIRDIRFSEPLDFSLKQQNSIRNRFPATYPKGPKIGLLQQGGFFHHQPRGRASRHALNTFFAKQKRCSDVCRVLCW